LTTLPGYSATKFAPRPEAPRNLSTVEPMASRRRGGRKPERARTASELGRRTRSGSRRIPAPSINIALQIEFTVVNIDRLSPPEKSRSGNQTVTSNG
jgi:hypothetical protein